LKTTFVVLLLLTLIAMGCSDSTAKQTMQDNNAQNNITNNTKNNTNNNGQNNGTNNGQNNGTQGVQTPSLRRVAPAQVVPTVVSGEARSNSYQLKFGVRAGLPVDTAR